MKIPTYIVIGGPVQGSEQVFKFFQEQIEIQEKGHPLRKHKLEEDEGIKEC